MADTVGQIEYLASFNTADFKKGAGEVDKSAKGVADGVEDSMGRTESAVRQAGHAVAAGLTVAGVGLTAFAKSATDFTVDYVKDVNKIARETGTTTEETSRLLYVFKRMGIETEGASAAFGIFSKKISEATNQTEESKNETEKLNVKIAQTKQQLAATQAEIVKNGDKTGVLSLKVRDLNNDLASMTTKLSEAAGPFAKLGVSTLDAAGKQRAFGEVLLDVADKFKELPDGANKTALSMELFGRSGKDLIPVLNKGSQGIQELEKQADKLGLTLTATSIAAVSKYVDSQRDLKASTDAVKLAVGQLTAPILTSFNQKLNETILALTNANNPFKTVIANVLAFGGPVAVAAGGVVEFASGLGTATEAAGGFKNMMQIVGKSFGWLALVVAAVAGLYYLEQRFHVFTGLWDALQPRLERFYQWFQVNILPTLRMVGDLIGNQLQAAWESFKRGIDSIITTLAPFHKELEVVAKIIGVVLVGALVLILLPIASFVAAIIGITVVVARVIGWITELMGVFIRLASVVGGAIGNFVGVVINGVNAVISAIMGLPGRILGAIGNTGSLLYDAGRNIIQGMINGIRDMVGNLTGAIKGVAQGAIDGAKATLGIHSPSTVFMGIGKNVSLGLARGITQAGNMAAGAMGNVIDSLPTSITSSARIDSFGSVGSTNGSVNNQPTVNLNVNMTGIMSRSKADERSIAKSLVQRLNEELNSKGQPLIGGGAI